MNETEQNYGLTPSPVNRVSAIMHVKLTPTGVETKNGPIQLHRLALQGFLGGKGGPFLTWLLNGMACGWSGQQPGTEEEDPVRG